MKSLLRLSHKMCCTIARIENEVPLLLLSSQHNYRTLGQAQSSIFRLAKLYHTNNFKADQEAFDRLSSCSSPLRRSSLFYISSETGRKASFFSFTNDSKVKAGNQWRRNLQENRKEKDEKPTSEKEEKNKGAVAKFKNIVNSFWLGCKQLMWIDARKAWATKKKLKSNDYDLTILTREELRHMRQTKKDIFKSLPVALLFFVPFIGYFAPVIGFLFPKKLLSQQFWNVEQTKKFAFEDHAKRSQYYIPLIQELGCSSKEMKNEELLKLCMKAIDRKQLENDDLLAAKDIFNKDIVRIDGMPRFHLVKLSKTWLLPVRWYIPSRILREYLIYRIKQILEDDQAIRREGMGFLTDMCIRQACHARGLDKYSFEIPVMKEWLTDWIKLTETVTDDDVSFVAHCAAFKTINFVNHRKLSEIEAEGQERSEEEDI